MAPHWLDSLTWTLCSACAAQTAEQGPVHNLGPSCWPGCKFHCRAPLTWSPRATSPYLLYRWQGECPHDHSTPAYLVHSMSGHMCKNQLKTMLLWQHTGCVQTSASRLQVVTMIWYTKSNTVCALIFAGFNVLGFRRLAAICKCHPQNLDITGYARNMTSICEFNNVKSAKMENLWNINPVKIKPHTVYTHWCSTT